MNAPQQTDIFFTDQERDALYKTLFSRRDVRGQFKADPIPEEVLSRVLYAAHHAPSVGFMQPWNFILVQSQEVRQQVHRAFTKAHQEAAEMFPEEKQELYRSLKLEGIMESPLNICITCDRKRTGPVVIGRTHIKEMDVYSSVCAIQNLWLAARAEGLGVGWVSIFDQQRLKEILNIPEHVVPVGYLCIGHVDCFFLKPELESAGWLPRTPIEELVSFNSWNGQAGEENTPLLKELQQQQHFPAQAAQK